MIWDYYKNNNRENLPWRKKIIPYRIWISEVMLQQTQVGRVKIFFENWMEKFPTVADLAKAPTVEILKMWKGLGYNSRAMRLKKAAGILVEKYGGKFPKNLDEILELPGIGNYTAGAIVAFAYDKKAVIIETNIRRVFIHHFWNGDADPLLCEERVVSAGNRERSVHDNEILELVEQTLPDGNFRQWYWALMDYGAHLGRELKMNGKKYNPNIKSRHYAKQSAFAGSDREIRSRILSLLLENKKMDFDVLVKKLSDLSGDLDRVEKIIGKMEKEGILEIKGSKIFLKK